MNCKPGDLAVVTSAKPEYSGMLVEVMYAPPSRDFFLPDGYPAIANDVEPSWVIRIIGHDTVAILQNGRKRRTRYGVGADRFLRPLRGDPDKVDDEHKQPVSEEPSHG